MSSSQLEQLRRSATGFNEPVSLLVATGQCGIATGARDVLDALVRTAKDSGLDVEIGETGCSGACHLNPQVTLCRAGHPPLTWGHVHPAQSDLLLSIAAGTTDPVALPEGWCWEPGGSNGLPGIDSMPFFAAQTRILLHDLGTFDPMDIDESLRIGRYQGLAEALMIEPGAVIDLVEESGLSGRGGAYFPIALKWRGCLAGGDRPRYLVVNAEEGEPGVFKDRHLLEGDPHLVIEGLLIAAYAIGAEHAFILLNGHAHQSQDRLQHAIKTARANGLVGRRILGTDFDCEIELRLGAGGYVLGEESVILEAIEGRRPMPRVRPPFPVSHGLWGQPTAINNVETLANLPRILRDGPDAFRELGTGSVPGTKLVCVTGNVQRPGLAEIAIGTPLRMAIESVAGGVPDGRSLQAVLTGGPSGVLAPPNMLDVPLEPRRDDILLGSGNLVVFDDRHDLLDIVRRLARFNAEESCGKCTPCREGTHRMWEILEGVQSGNGQYSDRQDLLDLCDIAAGASICGLGQMAPNPVRSGLTRFALPGFPPSTGAAR